MLSVWRLSYHDYCNLEARVGISILRCPFLYSLIVSRGLSKSLKSEYVSCLRNVIHIQRPDAYFERLLGLKFYLRVHCGPLAEEKLTSSERYRRRILDKANFRTSAATGGPVSEEVIGRTKAGWSTISSPPSSMYFVPW